MIDQPSCIMLTFNNAVHDLFHDPEPRRYKDSYDSQGNPVQFRVPGEDFSNLINEILDSLSKDSKRCYRTYKYGGEGHPHAQISWNSPNSENVEDYIQTVEQAVAVVKSVLKRNGLLNDLHVDAKLDDGWLFMDINRS